MEMVALLVDRQVRFLPIHSVIRRDDAMINVRGEMPEWSNGADSKSVVRLARTVGSNPTLSAIPT